MPIGVGSVGDIISLCLLAKDLVEALNNSRGAAAEYQEIVREIWGLERALLQIDLLSRTYNGSPELNALYETAHRSAEDCRVCIAAFLAKIKKYNKSLKKGGSGSIFCDASRKIQWQVIQSSEVSKFRAEIGAHSQSIGMLLATLSVRSMTVNDRKMVERLTESENKAEEAQKKQSSDVTEVKDRLEENNRLISTVATKVSEALRFQWFHQLGSELKSLMNKIFRTNFATYEAVVAIQRVLPSHLERTMFRDPFILEDAIGRISPVHMDFVNSWEAFDAVLRLRFQDVQGFKKVQNKEYILQEHATKREIARTRPWEIAFLPGQRVDMSLIFMRKAEVTEEVPSTSCPNCQAVSTLFQDSEQQCRECGMWYRRITEFMDVDPPSPVRLVPPRSPVEKVQFGRSAFMTQAFGPKPPSKFPPVSVKRKLEPGDLAEDDIAHFKRVRLITSKERTRPISGPFVGVKSSSIDLSKVAMAKHQEEESMTGDIFQEKVKILGASHPDTVTSLVSLTRILHNHGKASAAEQLLQKTLDAEESTLIEQHSKSLRLLMTSLMSALVDQKKLDAAENLWSRGRQLLLTKASTEESDELVRDFELAHPFRAKPRLGTEGGKDNRVPSLDDIIDSMRTRHSRVDQTRVPATVSTGTTNTLGGTLARPMPVANTPASGAEMSYEELKLVNYLKPQYGKTPENEVPVSPTDEVVNENKCHYMTLIKTENNLPLEDPATNTYVYPDPFLKRGRTLPTEFILNLSYFRPMMKNSPEQDLAPLKFADGDSPRCPRCSCRFGDSADLERHLAIYHPALYMSTVIAQRIDTLGNPSSIPEACWLWLAWVSFGDVQNLVTVKIGWKCCGSFSLTLAEFSTASPETCSSRDGHLAVDIPSAVEKLKALLDSVRKKYLTT